MLPGFLRSNVGIAVTVLAAVLVLSGLAHLVLGREGLGIQHLMPEHKVGVVLGREGIVDRTMPEKTVT